MEAYESKDTEATNRFNRHRVAQPIISTAQAVVLVTMMALFTNMWLVSIVSPFSVLLLDGAESLT